MIKLSAIFLLLASFSVSGGNLKKNDINLECVSSLQSLLSSITTISGSFKQVTYDEKGEVAQEAQGRLIAERPGKIRWVTDAPMEQHIVSDSKNIWIYDPDLEQVTVSKFSSDISKNPSLLLVGNISDIELSFSAGCKSGDAVDFTLTPITADSLYEKIQISFTGKTPSSMSLRDSLGRKTTINLTEVKINKVVSQKNFQFIPPDGVDVIWYK
ncbi:MAG: outer membrane lipoprotein carrier protein [Saprospiraceae bacterium]|jgi:outer membrane lipoprotein carrier protein|tara:strand:+ start:141 stop:779 length:639 start_codon:yes stop_codon:yes gene_type:complete